MLREQLLVRHELSLNVNPFTDSDVEDGTKDFMLVDEIDDKDVFIDVFMDVLMKKYTILKFLMLLMSLSVK